MTEIREEDARKDEEEALIEALTRPGQASMVDALLALPDDDAGAAREPLSPGIQAALAAKMRAVLAGRERREAA
jgi:hypothetical protein